MKNIARDVIIIKVISNEIASFLERLSILSYFSIPSFMPSLIILYLSFSPLYAS